MELTEDTKIFDGVDAQEFDYEYKIKDIDEPVRKYILGLSNVNIQLNKDIKEIAASLLEFKENLNPIYVIELEQIVSR